LNVRFVQRLGLGLRQQDRVPRVAGQVRQIDEILLDDIVEPAVLHCHRNGQIDRLDVGGLPRGLSTEIDVLELHLRNNLAAVKEQIFERLRADARRNDLWLGPAAFRERAVAII